ncbi:MAG: hypothetical protein MI717_05305 [Spirochaetales bacterium]|nr:hypothetical protein [Spirochaetales bacterium]
MAQQLETSDDLLALTAEQLLREALLFRVDISVLSSDEGQVLWNSEVTKITIPGRTVSVGLEGSGSRLTVRLTLYPSDESKKDEGYILVAQSEIFVGEEYSSSLSSLPVAPHDEVYYYPLGRNDQENASSAYEVRMILSTTPYWETLDEQDRRVLESAVDSSVQFDLTEKEPSVP